MSLRLTLALILSKITIKLLRLLKRGGTSLPGKVARLIYPNILEDITRDVKIIMVTGTNGKTTTARIIAQILKESGIDFITNKSGANLHGGIISTFVEASDLKGHVVIKRALIEIDEAAFRTITEYVKPEILIVTNFFRDQLDRYGELNSTLKGVREGIEKTPDTLLILNADDSLCASLGKNIANQVTYFGINEHAYTNPEETGYSDAMFCIFCKSKYFYKNRIFGHLGSFECQNCGYIRPETSIECTNINEINNTNSEIDYYDKSQNCTFHVTIGLPGMYNIYNSVAAIACGSLLQLPSANITKAVKSFECGFGRMESINHDGKTLKLILVKNPTGFNQVINYILTEEKESQIAFVINDNLADGTDISWLWDVDFEKFCSMQDNISSFYTSGIRAEDMAVRLKYAGIYTSKIETIKDYNELIVRGLSKTLEGNNYYILPTYTAMLKIRKILQKQFKIKEFWK